MFTEISDKTAMESAVLPPSDPLRVQLEEVEALLIGQFEDDRSSLGVALSGLVAAGGKRLRPRIALLVGNLLGADPQALTFLAAAIEALHTATLIHDDLIDGARLRRGLETLNARWSPQVSVLAGDLAFTRASRLILQTACLPVIGLFTETMARMVSGEIRQLIHAPGSSGREGYFRWIHAKTAAMFALAAEAPARLSPAGGGTLASARTFGYCLGMAFQIVDDILDFTGDAALLGKPVGNDLRQGTVTLPALVYLEAHPEDTSLTALSAGDPVSAGEVERLIAAIRRSDAIDRCQAEADGFLQRGLAALGELPATAERQALAEIAVAMVHRDR